MEYFRLVIIFVVVLLVITTENGAFARKRPSKCTNDLLKAVEPIKECGQLPNMEFGHATLAMEEKQAIGSLANIKCIYGYKLVGKSTIHCQINAQWSMPMALCLPIECPPVPKIDNGYYEQLGLQIFGSVATLICDTGFSLSMPPVVYIQCKANGQWTNPNGMCRKDCGLLPNVDFGKYRLSHRYDLLQGALAELECNKGYQASGVQKLECINNGGNLEWSSPIGSCVPKDCPMLVVDNPTANGEYVFVKGNGRSFGSVAIFKCLDCFNLITDTIAVCKSDREWWRTGIEFCVRGQLITGTTAMLNGGSNAPEIVDNVEETCLESDRFFIILEQQTQIEGVILVLPLESPLAIGDLGLNECVGGNTDISTPTAKIFFYFGCDTLEDDYSIQILGSPRMFEICDVKLVTTSQCD